jgi:hypothetical protein
LGRADRFLNVPKSNYGREGASWLVKIDQPTEHPETMPLKGLPYVAAEHLGKARQIFRQNRPDWDGWRLT